MVNNPSDHGKTLIMGHTGSPETLVPDQITTPGKKPKNFYISAALVPCGDVIISVTVTRKAQRFL
jgi:hypothetical protein